MNREGTVATIRPMTSTTSIETSAAKGRSITIALIPQTLRSTHWIITKRKGSKVNIETDILAKYVKRQFLQNNMGELFQKKQMVIDDLIQGGFE